MITDQQIKSIKKRFPKSFKEFNKSNDTITWEDIKKWIEGKGHRTDYYSIGLTRIEKGL